MTIPTFPQFKKLHITDKTAVEKITFQHPPYSDFNFASLWNYDVKHTTTLSLLNSNLVIVLEDYTSDDMLYTFIGHNRVIDTTYKLLSYVQKRGHGNSLHLIPESVIQTEPRLQTKFHIAEDPDHHDYILDIKETAGFKGKQFANKRKKVKRFIRSYPDHVVSTLDPRDTYSQREIMELFRTWVKLRQPSQDSTTEQQAISRFLGKAVHFDVLALGVWDSSGLIGCTLTEIDAQGYPHAHFLKTNPTYIGLYEYIDAKTSEYLYEKGHTHLNIQQDMGIPGLREAKKHSKPAYMLKKYILSS